MKSDKPSDGDMCDMLIGVFFNLQSQTLLNFIDEIVGLNTNSYKTRDS